MWDEDRTAPKIRPDSMEKRLSTSIAGTPRAINTKMADARHNAVLCRLRTHLVTAAVITTLISTILATDNASAQAVDRPRPQQWERLVKGGRFMDRILPMPDGRKAKHTWGTAEVAQRFVDNGIEMPDTSFWGGNILKGDDGLYHMYVCGWPEDSPQGHMFWPNSTVYHAVAKRLHGPYTIRETVGKGHNPEAYRLDDGRIVIYVIGGYYIADSFDGPWQYAQFEFDRRDRPVIEGLSNLTFARRDDGSRLMVCRGGGVWISRDGLKPYRQITEKRIYPPVDGEFEDPVVWRDSLQYHLIVNDWLGRIAYYQRSIDGVHWVTEQGEAYVPGVSVHKDGYIEQWFKYERPKIFQDGKGRVEQINFAVIDTIKVRITDRAKAFKETEVVFYDVSGLREAQKDLNSIVENNLLAVTAPAHLYALVGATDVKAEFTNNSKSDTYKVEIRRNKDNALIADAFELAAGKSILTLTLLEAPEFGNVDCTVTVTAFRDGKQIGSMQTELTLHAAYLWPKEVL